MLLWIESQSTSIIALIVFSAAYFSAALIFGLAALLSRRPIGKALQWVTPGILSPLGTILGILILPGGAGLDELGSRPGAYRPRSERIAGGRHAGEFPARGRQDASARGDRKTP